jgi:hypothetical protein
MSKLAISVCSLLVVCAALPLARAEEGKPASPEQIIRQFYEWYVQAVVANDDPLTKRRAELKRFATDRLIREIDGMRKGPDGLDGDYFLDAQDFDAGWGKNITVANVTTKGTRTSADVQLKSREMGVKKLRVTLAQERGAWKVDKVEGR